MEKTVDETGDTYQNITISGGTVGAIGGRGHVIEQSPSRTPEPAGAPASDADASPSYDVSASQDYDMRASQDYDVSASQDYDVRAVRDLLLAAFTAADLRRLFTYAPHPELRQAIHQFAMDDGLAALADKAIEFCQKRDLLPELLAEVERLRPRMYARYMERLKR